MSKVPNRSRGRRSASGRPRQSTARGSVGGLLRLWRTASESGDALNALTEAYNSNQTLPHMLAAMLKQTSHRADDVAAHRLIDALAQTAATAAQVASTLESLASLFNSLADDLEAVVTQPLKPLVESYDVDED